MSDTDRSLQHSSLAGCRASATCLFGTLMHSSLQRSPQTPFLLCTWQMWHLVLKP